MIEKIVQNLTILMISFTWFMSGCTEPLFKKESKAFWRSAKLTWNVLFIIVLVIYLLLSLKVI